MADPKIKESDAEQKTSPPPVDVPQNRDAIVTVPITIKQKDGSVAHTVHIYVDGYADWTDT